MPSVADSGTLNAAPATPTTLATITTPGTYVLKFSRAALLAGELLTVTLKDKVLAGGASAVAYSYPFPGGSDHEEQVITSPPMVIDVELVVAVLLTASAARDVPWKILRLDA